MKEEDEEEELFYESLDRILSASCSSTSNSDEESDERLRLRRRVPCLPPLAATCYDVWISEPSSIEDRRHRLLHQLGLAGDPTLSRRKSPIRSRSDGDRFLDPETPRYVSDYGSGDLDRSCTIKNLDNGEEFVVKEDGVRNRMRDLTVEEFEMFVGRSPIVQELMRRQNVEDFGDANGGCCKENGGLGLRVGSRKKGGWLKRIKKMAGNVVAGGYYRERRSSEERDSSSEKRGERRSSSATDDSQDGWLNHGPEWIRVRQYGKSWKEFNGLCLTQENQAHAGSIWCIKFSLDGKYLASAGEDCVIHVWQVSVIEKKVDLENGYHNNPFVNAGSNELPESTLLLACVEGSHWEKKRRARLSNGRKSASSDHFVVPDQLFALEEKPVCSFKGHLADVLDLSWSKSEYLLSSSMDKTVRLWHMSSNICLKTFSHTDYVTCIQFNPVDDRYFISGSLDEKVRIWSIPDRQIVDWNDLHEMVTSACYTPNGQGALVGSHKGSCHLYDTSDNKLHYKSQIDLQNRKKKSSQKKITGFQFAPGSLSEVLITSADSRIRVVDGTELVHKFKGFRNTSSQIAASLASNGKYVVCASEDSHVYIWRADAADAQPQASRSRVVSVTQSYEHFHCRDVTVAVPWPGGIMRNHSNGGASRCNLLDEQNNSSSSSNDNNIVNASTYPFRDRVAATWPEEKLLTSSNHSSHWKSLDLSNGRMHLHSRSALGMVIVTAGRSGQIRTFQNFGSPLNFCE